MNNSVFGKTMENLRKRINIQPVHHKKRLFKLSAKTEFKSFTIFNEDLASVELIKQKLVLNRPIYVGFSILELSKVFMYDFHYNYNMYIKKKYCACPDLCFTDTGSLCYGISTICMSTCWRIISTLTLVNTQIHIFSIETKTRKCWKK